MRIAIDARAYAWGGIGKYLKCLLATYSVLKTKHTFTILARQQDAAEITKEPWFTEPKFMIRVVGGSYYSWREQTVFLYQLSQVKADLWHFTHFNVPLFFRQPYVLTIHDIIRFIFPGQESTSLWRQISYELVFGQAVSKAKEIICVSQATKQSLEDLPWRLKGRVSVIYEGVSHVRQTLSKAQSSFLTKLMPKAEHFLLFVGVWMDHKNLARLLEAFSVVHRLYPEFKLVIAGQHTPSQHSRLASWLNRFDLKDAVVVTGFIPEDMLGALYARATCLVFPSLYEGFGLPALEAAAHGTPVITSNVAALPEIMGEAAHYVNPESVMDIVLGIRKIIEDQAYAKSLGEKGRSRAGGFSWQQCASDTLAVYERAARK